MDGQAEVMIERCIGCGNCVKVCSQGAKVYYDSKEQVKDLLNSGRLPAAIVAPSFAAEFSDISDYRKVVGMIRSLGFDLINEVAFGADLVAREYERLMEKNGERPHISSDCPAISYYIRQYHPTLTQYLAPLASPMVAITRALRKTHGQELPVVFIGPCVAKKAESDEINAALTFIELRQMFDEAGITPENTEASEFDPPYAGKGSIFPVSRGLLQTMNKTEDIAEGNIVVAEGRVNFKDALKEFEGGLLQSHHLELLCCEGCIMGPGMSKGGKRYMRRTQIGKYVQEKLNSIDQETWEKQFEEYKGLDLTQKFKPIDRRLPLPEDQEVEEVLVKMGKKSERDHLNCGACGYETCRKHAIAIVEGLAEVEMCLPYTIEKLHQSVEELNVSNEKLANTRMALKQSEKLASMGQLSAGIAHELNNPLGVITMYSNILKEEAPEDSQVHKDLELIVEQANRCKTIVGGLLNFARKNQVKLEDTDICEFIRHSSKSLIKPDNVEIAYNCNIDDRTVQIDHDQMMQVMTNLQKNAVEAMPDGGTLTLAISGDDSTVEISVTDTGIGIPKENMDKLFTPFFTTKKMGKGTGLGLPLIYGIVKMHKGQVQVTSNADPEEGATGTTFKITIPRRRNL
jgi:iron only hydrogenase large subunit-like protein/nitrogen-specific signal transduction histidine kinase